MSDFRREIKDLMRELERQGFRIRGGRHWVVYPPDRTKRVMTLPRTPSDRRAMLNLLRDLRSVGFKGLARDG